MNKNQNTKKKRKGFTLIELIIVLAIMAIIAAIAIPNFAAVRDNSKNKADVQSCETIKRTVLMLVADGTIKPATASTDLKEATFTSGNDSAPTYSAAWTNAASATTWNEEHTRLMEAVKDIKAPQSTKGVVASATGELSAGTSTNADSFKVSIDEKGNVTVTVVHK